MSSLSADKTCPNCRSVLSPSELKEGRCRHCGGTISEEERGSRHKKSLELSVSEALRFAWRMLLQHFGVFLAVFLILVLIQIAQIQLTRIIPSGAQAAEWATIVGGMLVSILVQLGLIKFGIHMAEEEEADLSVLLRQSGYFLQYTIASILYTAVVFLGLLLLILPGIYLVIKLQFFGYFILDQDAGPVESLALSYRLTQDAERDLLKFVVIIFLINLTGLLISVVGAFITMPFTLVATAHMYVQLRRQKVQETPDGFSTPGDS